MSCYHISGNHLNRVWSGAYSVPIKSVFPSEVLFGELPPVVGMKGSIANNEAQKRINKALDSFEKEKK